MDIQIEMLPEWESDFVDEVIRAAEERLAAERGRAQRRAVQLSREQGYHRLAVAIDPVGSASGQRGSDRPRHLAGQGQLSLFPEPNLFDPAG